MSNETMRVGEWTADLMRGCLLRQGEARPVEPKVMELLFVLASERSRVFGHAELRAALWPDTVVGDDSLTRCVSKLRRALSDGGKDMIETIPKRGYRLAVDEVRNDTVQAPRMPWPRYGIATALALVLLLVGVIATTMVPQRAPGVTQADVDRAKALAEQDAARQAAAGSAR